MANVTDAHDYARSGRRRHVGQVDFTHPACSKQQPGRDNGGWAEAKVFYAAAVDAGGARVAARLSDGTPLLLDKQIGEGHVLLLASGLENLTNDLPLHPVFVAFVDRVARYLSGSERLSGSRLVDSFVQLRAAAESASEQGSVEVIDPDGRRPLSLSEARTAQTLRLERAGFYQIRFAERTRLRDRRQSGPARIGSGADADDVQQLWSGSARQRRIASGSELVTRRRISCRESVVVRYAACIDRGAGGDSVRQPLHGHAAGGNMSKQSELNSYIAQLQQRLRLGAWVRGAAIFTGTALVVTVALVLLLNHLRFRCAGVTGARLALVLGARRCGCVWHCAAAGAPDASPRRAQGGSRESRTRAAPDDLSREASARAAIRSSNCWRADTLQYTQDAAPASLVEDKRLFALGGAGLACLAVLVWMIAAGPGYLGYGASLLWTGPQKNALPLLRDRGHAGQRRGAPQQRSADHRAGDGNAAGEGAALRALSKRGTLGAGGDAARSRTRAARPTYQFVFAGLPENVEYYVPPVRSASPHYKVRVVDLAIGEGDSRHLSLSEVDRHEARDGGALRRSARDRRHRCRSSKLRWIVP